MLTDRGNLCNVSVVMSRLAGSGFNTSAAQQLDSAVVLAACCMTRIRFSFRQVSNFCFIDFSPYLRDLHSFCAVSLRVCMCAWALFSRSPTALLSHDVFRFVNAFRCTQLNDPFFTAPPASASWIRPRIISCYCCACRCAGFLLFFFLTTNCLTGSPFD